MAEPGPKTKFAWGVIRREPWHLDSVYETESEAAERAKALGEDYAATRGEPAVGTDDYIWSATKAG